MHAHTLAGTEVSESNKNDPELAMATSTVNSSYDDEWKLDVDGDGIDSSSVKSSSRIGSLETKRDTYLTEEQIKDKFGEEMEVKFVSLRQALKKKENSTVKIEKVPSILRNNNDFEKYYVPKMVSIGPYHHKDGKLKMTENLKLKFARLFITKHGLEDHELYSKIKEDIQNLKEYYEAEATKEFDENALAWMFLVDGCTILCYIYYAMREDEKRLTADLDTKVDRLRLLKQDLLLLENQLPYRVLDLIMSSLKDKEARDMKKAIDEFIFQRIKAPEEKYVELLIYQDDGKLIHLLDLVRKRLIHSAQEDHNSCSINIPYLMMKAGKFITDPLDRIKDFIEIIGKAFERSPHDEKKHLHFFRNIEELKAVGIRLKASNTSSLTSISFDRGTLKLPPIRIDDSTISRFLNLIAYEMCPNSDNNFGICSFVVFLDAFIDREQDVKLLRDNQILQNALGSDDEVAKLFNVISVNLMSNPETYKNVKTVIQRRYENKLVTWMAQFNHQHFHSPWSVIAFLAAIIAITSSVVQTVYTILGFYNSK